MNTHQIDYITKTIFLTKKFAKAASTVNSPEYNTMRKLRADFPDFSFELREIKRPQKKQSYARLNYDVMRKYIRMVEGEDSNNLQHLETIIEMSQGQAGHYAYVKTWFLHHYPKYKYAAFFESQTTH